MATGRGRWWSGYAGAEDAARAAGRNAGSPRRMMIFILPLFPCDLKYSAKARVGASELTSKRSVEACTKLQQLKEYLTDVVE